MGIKWIDKKITKNCMPEKASPFLQHPVAKICYILMLWNDFLKDNNWDAKKR